MFKNVDEKQFYRAVNESKPSLIRIDADELTYPLHIMVRYEIEKAIFTNEVTVDELPELWNAKYQGYLGVIPETHAKGILQDVHWAGGDFGYFPSYALGYMYAAQFKHKMMADIPEFDRLVEKGEFAEIIQWLKQNVHVHGKRKKPLEIIREVTGEDLNVQYLIDYLTNKYDKLYLQS
jgi:carboxypeptidase Taq